MYDSYLCSVKVFQEVQTKKETLEFLCEADTLKKKRCHTQILTDLFSRVTLKNGVHMVCLIPCVEVKPLL